MIPMGAHESEDDIQEAIVTWLHLAYPQALVYEFGKIGGHRALAGAVPTGWPDLLVIMVGTLPPSYVHLEVKSEKGVVSAAQQETKDALHRIGANCHVIRSVAEVREILVDAGFEPRGGL